jgi:hypothetical protein
MAALGEKLSTDPWIGQSACCGLCPEPFFSGAVALSINIDDFVKGCHIRELPTGSVHEVYVGWRGKYMCHVDQIFSCRVYINSNHRGSQI